MWYMHEGMGWWMAFGGAWMLIFWGGTYRSHRLGNFKTERAR